MSNRRQLLGCVALLAVAWVSVGLGVYQASRLDLTPFGECGDVCDALARDGYVARHELPYWRFAVVAALASAVLLVWADVRQPGLRVWLVFLALASPTWALHLFGWLVTSVFAG